MLVSYRTDCCVLNRLSDQTTWHLGPLKGLLFDLILLLNISLSNYCLEDHLIVSFNALLRVLYKHAFSLKMLDILVWHNYVQHNFDVTLWYHRYMEIFQHRPNIKYEWTFFECYILNVKSTVYKYNCTTSYYHKSKVWWSLLWMCSSHHIRSWLFQSGWPSYNISICFPYIAAAVVSHPVQLNVSQRL